MAEKSDLLRELQQETNKALQQKIHYYHITSEGLIALDSPGRLEGDQAARAALTYLRDVGKSPSLDVAEMLHEAWGYDLDEGWETLQYLRKNDFVTITVGT